MFNNDDELNSWINGQLWVIRNTQSAPNDMIPLPAGRVIHAFDRLCQLLAPLLLTQEAPAEYERRSSNPEKPRSEPMRDAPQEKKETRARAVPTRRAGLTEREMEVFKAIKADLRKGINPTQRALAERIGLKSVGQINSVMKRLVALGYIDVIGARTSKRIVLV